MLVLNCITALLNRKLRQAFTVSLTCLALGAEVSAQNLTSTVRDWHGSWGFSSPTQQSLDMSRARLIEERRAGGLGPSNSFVTYDNRSNYIDQSGTFSGSVEATNRVGDEIGRNTNVVGAMNTGETRIDVVGDGNKIDAINAADSSGCLDGSINEGALSSEPAGVSALANVLAQAGIGNVDAEGPQSWSQSVVMGNTQSGCLP